MYQVSGNINHMMWIRLIKLKYNQMYFWTYPTTESAMPPSGGYSLEEIRTCYLWVLFSYPLKESKWVHLHQLFAMKDPKNIGNPPRKRKCFSSFGGGWMISRNRKPWKLSHKNHQVLIGPKLAIVKRTNDWETTHFFLSILPSSIQNYI